MKDKISSQYFTLNPITVTVLNVVNPASFILRESPGVNSSADAKNFAEAEESLQKYYASIEPSFFQMPLKDSIVVVLFEKKFYRAKVVSILSMSSGHLFKVYLLDYGKECNVPRPCIYEIQKDFLSHPYQAVNFKLLGLEPVSLVMNNLDLSMSLGPVAEWDLSAGRFLNELKKEMCSVCIEVKAVDENFLYGNLYMSFDDGTVRCINQEFITNKFACFNEDCWGNVKKIGDVIENLTSNQNRLSVPLCASSEISTSPSPIAKAEIKNIKVAFLRPSDGKIMAESSLMNDPLELPSKISEESFEQKFLRPSDGKIMAESSLMNDPLELPSKISEECLEQKFLIPLDGKRMAGSSLMNDPVELPSKISEENLEQKVHVSPTNMLQKLRKLKSQSHNQSSSLTDSISKSAEEPAHQDTGSPSGKESSSNGNAKNMNENKSPTGLSDCSKNNTLSPKHSLNLTISSTTITPPKQENISITSPPKVASGMLLKLQRLKGKKFEESEKPVVDSKKNEEGTLNIYSAVSTLDNSELNTNLNQLVSHPVSPHSMATNVVDPSPTSPSKLSVDIGKVKAFYRRRKLSHNFTTETVQVDESETKMEAKLSVAGSKAVPHTMVSKAEMSCSENCTKTKLSDSNSSFLVTNVLQSEQSENYTETKLSATDSSVSDICVSSKMNSPENCVDSQSSVECQFDEFLLSSIEKNNKRTPKASDKHISEIINLSPVVTEKSSDKSISSSESLSKSFSDSISSPPQTINSEILKALSDMSDSDDVLYTLSRRKYDKNDSSDVSDVDESYSEYAKLEHSVSNQLDFSSLWEKQKVPALQIGEALSDPILCTEEAGFSSHLHRVLQEIKFYSPSCIQSVVWPAMQRSRCLIAIAPPNSGKTVAFVLPLVSAFTGEVPLSKGIGPIAIVLCSSWKKAQVVSDLFRLFLGESTKIKIITLCADGGSLKHKIMNIINGCDVLISTPFCLLQCFEKKLVNFSRCKHFILDDGTTLINVHKKELKRILLHFIKRVKEKKVRPQIAIFAERWNSDFKLILKKLMSLPVLFFTSFLESAIFAGIPIEGHVCDESEKKKILLGLVKDAGKVVISTSSLEDSVDVHHFLRCEDVKTYLVNEEMEHYIADEVIKDWKSAKCMTSSHCLVITDQALIKMCISNADCLIHYDIPHDSRLQFGNRFSCIAEHFKEKGSNQKCICHVFITKLDTSHASHLIRIIESSGKAPQELKEMCNQQEMVENSSGPLCNYFKAFGFCKKLHCKHRHIIDSVIDQPRASPYEGDIQGLVTHVVDASHCYIRLLKYIDLNSNKTVSLTAAYADIGFRLRDFYCHMTDEMEIKSPVIGESYVLVEDNILFYRIKVLDKIIPSSLAEFPKWKILFLDEGWVKCYEKLKLYALTDQIELPRPLVVEAYVCNIMTPDSCLDWNPQTTLLVCDLIKSKEIFGKIVLCLGETLWLDPIVLRTQLYNINTYVNTMKVNKQIIDLGHAKDNKDHLISLQQACSGKVPLPCMIEPTVKKEETRKDQFDVTYAFLECDVFEEVYVSNVISPHQLYVQRSKFVECLDKLLDEMNTQIQNKTLKKNFTVYKGMHCIAPFHEDNRYYRAVITDILSDTEVQLFYADFGDSGNASRNDIYYLPPKLLLLPYQAIECELVGIAAAHGGWTDSAADTLYNLTRDIAGDMKILLLKAYSKTCSYKGGSHYVVELWYDEKNVSQQLLDAGFGIPAEIPMTAISLAKPNVSEQTNDESFDLDDTNTSDSEINSEEKDAAVLFCGVISGLLQPSNSEVPTAIGPVTITEVPSDDETIIDSNKVSGIKLKNLKKISPKSNEVDRYVKVSEQQNNSLKPLLTWWDTPQQLSILINLKEVKVYDLFVRDEEFSFKTIIAGFMYSTEEKLYGKVHSSDASVSKTAQGISIVVKKHMPFKWPRLVQDKRKFLHIKYDLIHIDDSESDEHTEDISNYKQSIQENEYPMEESSDATDNEEKYVQPWKKVAQYKDPYNLLE